MSARRVILLLLLCTLAGEAIVFVRQARREDALRAAMELSVRMASAPSVVPRQSSNPGIDDVPRPASAVPLSAVTREAKRWLEELKLTQEFFAHHPDHMIPEMALLGDKDILVVLKDADTSTESGLRKALSDVRAEAKGKFADLARKALKNYLAAHANELPENPLALMPYADVALTSEMLERYRMTKVGVVEFPKGRYEPVIAESAGPVDAEYDSNSAFGLEINLARQRTGGTYLAYSKALTAYREAHGKSAIVSATLDQLRSYLPAGDWDEGHLELLIASSRRLVEGD